MLFSVNENNMQCDGKILDLNFEKLKKNVPLAQLLAKLMRHLYFLGNENQNR